MLLLFWTQSAVLELKKSFEINAVHYIQRYM